MAARRSVWLRGKGVEEVCPALGRAVEVRGEVERVAVQADSAPPLLGGEEGDHVRMIQGSSSFGSPRFWYE